MAYNIDIQHIVEWALRLHLRLRLHLQNWLYSVKYAKRNSSMIKINEKKGNRKYCKARSISRNDNRLALIFVFCHIPLAVCVTTPSSFIHTPRLEPIGSNSRRSVFLLYEMRSFVSSN